MKRKFSHLHFHDLNIQWISCWYWLTGLFFPRRPLANRNYLLTDAFHRTWMMSWSIFHWFSDAAFELHLSLHLIILPPIFSAVHLEHRLRACAIVPSRSLLQQLDTSFWTRRACSMPGDGKNIFKYPGHSNDVRNLWRCCSASCFDPSMMANRLRDTS